MFKKLYHGLAVLAAFAIAGCASMGESQKIGVTMPRSEKATIVAHNQWAPDWALSRDGLKMNYIVRGDVKHEQLLAVAEAERACRIYTGIVRPSNLVGVLSTGVLYAAAGAAGVGLGARAAFAGAKLGEYAQYGGYASGFGGAANGVIQSGGQTYTFENCGRELLGLFPQYEVRVLNKSPY